LASTGGSVDEDSSAGHKAERSLAIALLRLTARPSREALSPQQRRAIRRSAVESFTRFAAPLSGSAVTKLYLARNWLGDRGLSSFNWLE
jgi:hypothetical protein